MDNGAVEAVGGVGGARKEHIGPALDGRAEHEVVDEELRAPVEEPDQGLRSVLGLEAVVLLHRDPRQRLPLPGELVAAAGELLLLCQQRGAGAQPLRARPDDLAHDPISIEGDPPGSVSPGTLAGDTATQIPRATRATAKTGASTIVVPLRAMRCSVSLASFPRSSPLDVPEGENSTPRDGSNTAGSVSRLPTVPGRERLRIRPRNRLHSLPRYCTAVSASCGSRIVALSFRVGAGSFRDFGSVRSHDGLAPRATARVRRKEMRWLNTRPEPARNGRRH